MLVSAYKLIYLFLERPEAYLEPNRISKMKLFAKIVNDFHKNFNYFHKKLLLKCSTGLGAEYASEDIFLERKLLALN